MSAPEDPHGRRLSALDGSFLRNESPQAHMHVGWSAVFADPGDGERPTVQVLRERAAGKLHEVPWCRWRLEGAPLGLSEPRWVDDVDFDLSTRIVQLTEPDDRVSYGTFAALRSTVLSVPLDRSQPLWQIFLVPCLEDGRVGMVGKIHHALVDGIAALQIVGLILDDEDGAGSQSEVPWRPNVRSGPAAPALSALTDAAGAGLGAVHAGAAAAIRPQATVRRAFQGVSRLMSAALDDVLPRAPDSGLNVPIGARRTLVGYHATRAELSAARAGVGGTLNDIGLAVVAGALRALALLDDDQPQAPLKAMVPVSMRRADETAAGNRISMVYIQLPVHLGSPRERMEWVRDQMGQLKSSDRAAGTQALYETAGLLPPPLRSPMARAMVTPRVFNLTVSQSPGPRGALHLLGCELQEVYSVVPIAQGHALGIGMVRYRRELFFGCYADPDALPAVEQLPALLEAELRALGEAAPAATASPDAAAAPPKG
ncbi:MAG: wax ester/triacylglycerol synthase family O-acyltransferase [Thermoleophilaceae bacterium]